MENSSKFFPEELRLRTKAFAFEVLKLCRALPRTDEARIIGKQLLRAGMSVGANFRAVTRARSSAEFISKLSVVVEETDETLFWLEAVSENGILPEGQSRFPSERTGRIGTDSRGFAANRQKDAAKLLSPILNS